jgi:hypothetical protein
MCATTNVDSGKDTKLRNPENEEKEVPSTPCYTFYGDEAMDCAGDDGECGHDFSEYPGAVGAGFGSGRMSEVDAVEGGYNNCKLGMIN